MNFYQQAKSLILGTRLKRLSEKYLQEIGLIYQQLGIEFEASWFPVFYLLRAEESMTMTAMAADLEVSHSAISQMVNGLRKKGLVVLIEDQADARRKKVSLTHSGKVLLGKVEPVWTAMDLGMTTMWEDKAEQAHFFQTINQLEKKLDDKTLSRKTVALMPALDYQLVQLPALGIDYDLFVQESEGRFEQLSEHTQVWGALHQEMLLGALVIKQTADSSVVSFEQVFVKNDFRRKGIATALLKKAMEALGLERRLTTLIISDAQLPLVQLLLKEAYTFTIDPHQKVAHESV